MSTLLVLSPHLDDAVFSAGQFINAHPPATVATVFAGVPDASVTGRYDTVVGFADSQQAMARRRREDAAALAVLHATPVHFDFLDRQYRQRSADEAIAGRLREMIEARRPGTVLGPVGLVHPDHRQVARIWPAVVRDYPGITALAYQELPYGVQFAARAAGVVRAFADQHDAVELPHTAGARSTKERAILAYASQLAMVAPLTCLGPERLLRLFASDRAARAGTIRAPRS